MCSVTIVHKTPGSKVDGSRRLYVSSIIRQSAVADSFIDACCFAWVSSLYRIHYLLMNDYVLSQCRLRFNRWASSYIAFSASSHFDMATDFISGMYH